MDAVEYLKEKARMSKKCSSDNCNECLLSYANNEKGIYCDELEEEYPKKAVEIVENWAKENPVKTYLSVLLEKFPNAQLDDGIPDVCPENLFGINTKYNNCRLSNCNDCWNREYKEE